jgi:tol-pal system protein YbgF
VQQTQNQQRDMYGDADRRLTALEGGGPRASVSSGSGTDLPVPQGDDRANYQAAFDLLKDGKYNEAISGFRQFLTTFPTSALADNAQYWLGEAHYVNKQYTDALRDFRTVLEKYPDSRKTPDALLKIGFCNYELKNWAEARSSLQQVVQRFGDTTAARLASQRLAKMDGEGR